MFWPKLSTEKINLKVFEALGRNESYASRDILGVSESLLDRSISPESPEHFKNYPFLAALVANPNHIGCHTIQSHGEEMFSGTQQIEKDLVRICAEEIFKAEPNTYDGYVASGGTEANIEALWVYRNYFMRQENAPLNEIGLVFSEDAHYSISRAANLLGLAPIMFHVNENTREVDIAHLENELRKAEKRGIHHFIVVANLSTAMFGSVDDVDKIANVFILRQRNFKMHVDACFGGFMYPFTHADSRHNFLNPHISSVSLDANRILHAPYGTGIFLIRKNLLKEVVTHQVTYVRENDHTLCGSRSGALAVAVWVILHAYGSTGWTVKMNQLKDRIEGVCKKLSSMGVEYYHNPYVNCIAIKSKYIKVDTAQRFYLVPDTHTKEPAWYKVTIMPHTREKLVKEFLECLTPAFFK